MWENLLLFELECAGEGLLKGFHGGLNSIFIVLGFQEFFSNWLSVFFVREELFLKMGWLSRDFFVGFFILKKLLVKFRDEFVELFDMVLVLGFLAI